MNYPIGLTVCALLLSVSRLSAATHYVSLGSTNPAPPYTNWATAANVIQDAVDAAAAGDEVVVNNGIYTTGGRAAITNDAPNQVVVDKPLVVRSVNGPGVTTISPTNTARCVFLASNAILSGFTLTNGRAFTLWSTNVYLAGIGGGARGGTLTNCTLTGNHALADEFGGAGIGGGAAYSTLNNCTLIGNQADPPRIEHGAGAGGGACGSVLNNCTLASNTAGYGGGAVGSTLNNCTLTLNRAAYREGFLFPVGGGASGCTLNNCIVYANTSYTTFAIQGGEYPSPGEDDAARCTLNYCCCGASDSLGTGAGNITNAPLFIDSAGGNFRLQPYSPCVDAGNNAYAPGPVDLDGNPRIVHGTVDIGAYESQATLNWLPVFGVQPASRTNDAATTATISVVAAGAKPLAFHWRKNAVPLADHGNITGSATAVLTLTNVLCADAGAYDVVVTNGFGSATSAVATLVVIDPVIPVPPASQVGQWGQDLTLSVTATGTAPFAYQWWKEATPLPWATGASLTLTNLQAGDAGNYQVVVSNGCGSATSAVAVEAVNLASADAGFNPAVAGGVASLAVQADGKILVGGDFTTLGGQSRNNLGRLNADGTQDLGFDAGISGGNYPVVECLGVQGDGKILVGGFFTTLAGQTCQSLGRLNPDGTLDRAFNPAPNGGVFGLALQAEGKILVAGDFTTLGGQSRNYIGRLNADGTLDSAFSPGANSSVYSLVVQADGKILVVGFFITLDGQTRNTIGRLNADGTLDTGFNPGLGGGVAGCLALQADGKILVGGWFTTLGGHGCTNLGRLNSEGTLDTSFNLGANGNVNSLALQTDGKILVGGSFTTLGGQPRNALGRLNADGTLDSAFDPISGYGLDAGAFVDALAVQADGKILLAGGFPDLAGQPRQGLGRLNNTEPATQSLTYDGSTITWLRGGASPEVWRTTFEFSTDGTDWASLGAGTRIAGLPAGQAGGWQLSSVSLPSPTGTIRARGYVTGGQYQASAWFVETDLLVGVPPVILVNDPSFGFSSNRFGFESSGGAGQVVIVEASTNLATWSPVTTNTIGPMPVYFSEPYSAACPQRFYRLRVGP